MESGIEGFPIKRESDLEIRHRKECRLNQTNLRHVSGSSDPSLQSRDPSHLHIRGIHL